MKLSGQAVDTAIGAVADLLAFGSIEIYDGKIPDSPETAASGSTKLSTLAFNGAAFKESSDGECVAQNTINPGKVVASGTARWARLLSSFGTPVCDVTCGKSGADLNFNNVEFAVGADLSIDSMILRLPKK